MANLTLREIIPSQYWALRFDPLTLGGSHQCEPNVIAHIRLVAIVEEEVESFCDKLRHTHTHWRAVNIICDAAG